MVDFCTNLVIFYDSRWGQCVTMMFEGDVISDFSYSGQKTENKKVKEKFGDCCVFIHSKISGISQRVISQNVFSNIVGQVIESHSLYALCKS